MKKKSIKKTARVLEIEIYKEEGMKVPLEVEKPSLKVEEIINIPVFVTA